MADGDELIFKLGLDPASVQAMLKGVSDGKAKAQQAAGGPITLLLQVTGQSSLSDLTKKLTAAGKAGQEFRQQISDGLTAVSGHLQTAAMTIGAAGAAIVAGLGLASRQGAAAEQATEKLRNSFGNGAKAALDFAEALAKQNLAIGAGEVQVALARFNDFGKALGFSADKSAEMSERMAQLASDLSILKGVPFGEALDRVYRAMLKGGKGAVELGVNLDTLAVKQEAARLGFDTSIGELTDAQEAQARYNIILRETQGMHDKANASTKVFARSFAELKTQIGEAMEEVGLQVNATLQPYIEKLTQAVVAMREWIAKHPAFANGLILVAGAATVAAGFLGAAALAAKGLSAAISGWGTLVAGAGLVKSFSGAVAGLATGANEAAGALTLTATALGGLLVAAAGGWALGRLIDNLTGTSERYAKNAVEIEKVTAAQEHMTRAGVTAADANLVGADTMREFAIQTGVSGTALEQAQQHATAYAVQIRNAAKNAEEAAAMNAKFNTYLKEGLTPAMAFSQAMNENNRLLYLDALGSARSGEQAKELATLRGRLTEFTQALNDVEKKANENTKEAIELREKQAKAIEETYKKIATEREKLRDVLAQEVSPSDLVARQRNERRPLEEAYLNEKEPQRKYALQLELDTQAARHAAEQRIETAKQVKDAQVDATKAAENAELALAEARAKSTGTLQGDIAALQLRQQAEQNELVQKAKDEGWLDKMAEAKQALLRKHGKEREKLEVEWAQKRKNAAETAGKAAEDAELDLLDSRAKATDALEDDIAVMNRRMGLELAAAKSEQERAAIRRKYLADELKLIEDQTRARQRQAAEAKKDKDAAAKAYADDAKDAADRAKGKGLEVDIRQVKRGAEEQYKNVTDEATRDKIVAATNQKLDSVIEAAQKAWFERRDDLARDEAEYKKRRFASSAEKRAARDDLDKRQYELAKEAETISEGQARADYAKTFVARDAELARKKADEEAKKLAADEALAQRLREQQVAAAGGAVPGGAPGEPLKAEEPTAGPLAALGDKLKGVADVVGQAMSNLAGVAAGLDSLVISQAQFAESLSAFGETVVGKFAEMAENFGTITGILNDHTARLAAIDMSLAGLGERQAADETGLTAG